MDSETFNYFRDKREEAMRSQVPRALEIQKSKFLCAIGKAEQTTTEEDEKFVKQCNYNLNSFAVILSPLSKHWTDTIADKAVKIILDKYQHFDIGLYLKCAKAVYLTYSGNNVSGFYEAFTYVLTHARRFGDQSQNMFQLESNGNVSEFKIEIGAVSAPLPDTKYMREVTKLIEDLKTSYDETKYKILNGNVTYLILLILRRFVKGSSQLLDALNLINTHDDYVKLCPRPLNCELPKISKQFNTNLMVNRLKSAAYLVIHAFFTVEDERSKRILRRNCIQYFEWTGLQLPELFFRVAKLYGIEEALLWDNLCFNNTFPSLFKLADNYYMQYKKSKDDPPETAIWFPYCRALDGSYHKDLSGSENKIICMILAYVVDLKIGFEQSRVRDSHWTKTNVFKKCALDIATYLTRKLSSYSPT